jgi:hypothetical protein
MSPAMTTPTRLLLALSISLTLNAAAADKPVWYGEANCRIAALEPHPAGDFVKWRGKCKDGYADGAGVLEWGVWGHGDRTLEANLARGEVVGEGTLVDEKGTYIGTFRNGVPHGQGYFKYADGDGLYEGGVANGLREGAGIFIARDRSRYEGGWKADKRHGHGRETFARGGSYEGGWKDDQFDGHGKIVYAGSGRTFEGQFENGRVAGTPAPEVDTTPKFSMRETEPASSRSRTPEFALRSNVPFDAKWTELTVAQQNSFKKGYPALESGDEPPYPTDGWGVRVPESGVDPLRFARRSGAAIQTGHMPWRAVRDDLSGNF